jgi:hypothetical protein
MRLVKVGNTWVDLDEVIAARWLPAPTGTGAGKKLVLFLRGGHTLDFIGADANTVQGSLASIAQPPDGGQ